MANLKLTAQEEGLFYAIVFEINSSYGGGLDVDGILNSKNPLHVIQWVYYRLANQQNKKPSDRFLTEIKEDIKLEVEQSKLYD